MDILDRYDVFVFDLDNTLYEEKKYLAAAYKEISRWLNDKYPQLNDSVESYLTTHLASEGRKDLFNKMETHFEIHPSQIGNYLRILRSVKLDERMPIYPKQSLLLRRLGDRNKQIAILTNGNPEQQKNKISQLEWPIPLDSMLIVYANEFEPKPSPKGLEFIKNRLGNYGKMIFIGDDEVDELAARAAAVDYLHFSFLEDQKSYG